MKRKLSFILAFILLISFTTYSFAANIITDLDYKRGNEQADTDVKNMAPNVDFGLVKKKLADVVILTDYTGDNITNLASQLNSLKSGLASNNVDMKYNIIDGTNKVSSGSVPISDSPMSVGEYYSIYGSDSPSYLGLNSDLTVKSNEDSTTGLSNIKKVRKYKAENFAITNDGRMYGWGSTGLFASRIPIEYMGSNVDSPTLYTDISDVKDYIPNGNFGLALKNDGTVWCNGLFFFFNFYLTGPAYNHYAGFYQISGYSNIKQIVNTGKFILALKNDGTVWGQGDNLCYQLGDVPTTGTEDSYGYMNWYSDMVQIPGLTDVVKIFGFNRSAFAIKSDGSVWAWGESGWGELLGVATDGSSKIFRINRYSSYPWMGFEYKGPCVYSPKQVPGLDGNSVSQIVGIMGIGGLPEYTMIVKKDGTLWRLSNSGLTQITETRDQYIETKYYSDGSKWYTTKELTPHRPLNDIVHVDSQPGITGYLKKDGTVIIEEWQSYQPSGWAPLNYVRSSILGTGVSGTMPVYSADISKVNGLPLRKGSDRYFICISNSSGNNYSGTFGSYYSFGNLNSTLATYLGNNNFSIYAAVPSSAFDYISDTGQQGLSIRNLVNSSVNEGKLYDVSQFSSLLNDINVKYVNTGSQDKITQYVVIDEDNIENITFYDDGSNDPMYLGQWQYTHNPTYFENSNGLYSNSGQWLNAPLLSFAQVGKYDVVYRATDNPHYNNNFADYRMSSNTKIKMTIYAHRRPIAQFDVTFSGINGSGYYITNTVSSSFDLDHASRTDRGIVQEAWQWKELSATNWNDGILPGLLEPNKTYIVKLKVMDLEETWSDPAVKVITTKAANMPPTVDANPISREWTNTGIPCTITASDPNGDYAYTNYMWSTSPVKPSSGWQKNISASFGISQGAEGIWYLHMEAWDAAGNSFYRMRGPYKIDLTKPTGVYNPPSHAWTNQDVPTIFAPQDAGGSGVKQWRYRKSSNNGSTYGTWSSYIAGDTNWTIVNSETGLNVVQAEVQDNAGNINYVTSGIYYIDKIPPTVSVNPPTLTSMEHITVTVTSGDTGGSGLKQTNYKWSTSTDKPTYGWSTSVASSFTTTLTDDSDIFYLHTEAYDNAGNVTYRMFGPYKYESLKITDVKITGYWNHWRGQVDLFGKRMTNEPHRFLSLEKVKIAVTTIGDPDKIEVRFNPELESMLYTDPYGNKYDYGEKVGYYVSFPQKLTVNNNTAVWEYILPLAPSTKDWDNRVLRTPYWMKVTAYKGSATDTYTVADINITGNTYDLIYIQPTD